MIDFYFWPTPNTFKVAIFLEESGLDYTLQLVDLRQQAQFGRQFLKISPNNKIPAIVDHAPEDQGLPLKLFESAAILEYLADKTGRFTATTARQKAEIRQWLHWQMSGIGAAGGRLYQLSSQPNREQMIPAIEVLIQELTRLYSVIDKRLADRPYVAGEDYTIADMALYPWIKCHEHLQQALEDYPHLKRWFGTLSARPAIRRTYTQY